jgi:hypothetical protein
MKPFTPSSSELLRMIRAAEARFDSDREQARLREEARETARAERFWVAQAQAQRWVRLYGGAA